MEHTKWYGKTQSSGQGLVYDDETGQSIAVAYNPDDAERIAKDHNAAPDLLEALQALAAICEDEDRFPLHTETAALAIAKATQ